MKISKIFVVIFLILIENGIAFSQSYNATFLSIDSLKDGKRYTLSSWLYCEGNDSILLSEAIDTSKWETVNPLLECNNTDENFWKGIGFFRKTIIIDSTLYNTIISIQLEHFGASEIYINNKLVLSDSISSLNLEYHAST